MTKLALLVGGEFCAEIDDDGGKPHLRYDMASEGVKNGKAVSCSMPPQSEQYGGAVISNWLWNLLPDNQVALDEIAKDESNGMQKCSARNPVRLLQKIGQDCAGAVQIVDFDKIDTLNVGAVDPISEDEIGSILAELRTGKSHLGQTSSRRAGKFSLAGAQPKTALRFLNGRWGMPSGKEPTTHILKPPIQNLNGQVENEHFCLSLAKMVGMRAPASEVGSFAGEKAIIVERFDRDISPDTGEVTRVHIEDMCQALMKPPGNKYQEDGGPGIISIANNVLSKSSSRTEDTEQFMLANVFNWIVVGTDAHAKNYSVYVGNGGRDLLLTPLYDINSFMPYPSRLNQIVKLSMSVSGQYNINRIFLRHWEKVFSSCGLDASRASDVIEEMCLRILTAVPALVDKCIIDGLDEAFIVLLGDLIAGRAEKILEGYKSS